MKQRSLKMLLVATSLGAVSGCAVSSTDSVRSGPLSIYRNSDGEQTAKSSTGASTAQKKTETPDNRPFSFASFTDRFRRSGSNEELSADFREAQKVLKKNPEKTLLAWARYQEDIGEYAEARRKYHELQIAYPNNIEAALGLARIEVLTGRTRQAEEILRGVAQRHPENIDVRLAFGRLYSQQERWDDAIRSFEEACELQPNDQTCRYELGIALAQSHQFDPALAHLTFAVGEPAAHYNIGYILNQQGRHADAVEWFRTSLQRHPDQQTAERARTMLAELSKSAQENGRGRSSVVSALPASNPMKPSGNRTVQTSANADPQMTGPSNRVPSVSPSGNSPSGNAGFGYSPLTSAESLPGIEGNRESLARLKSGTASSVSRSGHNIQSLNPAGSYRRDSAAFESHAAASGSGESGHGEAVTRNGAFSDQPPVRSVSYSPSGAADWRSAAVSSPGDPASAASALPATGSLGTVRSELRSAQAPSETAVGRYLPVTDASLPDYSQRQSSAVAVSGSIHREGTLSGQPLQWHGPAPQMNETVDSSGNSVSEPPIWRARRN